MTPQEIRKKIKVGSRVRLKRGAEVYQEGRATPVRSMARPNWVDVNKLYPGGDVGWIGTGSRQFYAKRRSVDDIEDRS
ncbi:hypothetical protein CcrC1_gp233c [Caulobacter phage C1]|nr:hypothetical protein CcrC1_gp233c [Caulobacter phage C1]UTU08462.1 hypothetical protein CcrC2_gp234c [Caulobacter phage C2]UTU08979.1 hypothetical protein CcrJ4_gp228c [Caulobacter phage J4]UTU10095.1 hypothetical protein CcrRB23_gp233c [Caulobacter phage RB23]WGN97130.1 hypothetical protein [Bertelyvirus sp.]